MLTFQVQPQSDKFAEYVKLGLDFEIMNFAYPKYNELAARVAYEGMKIPSMHAAFIDVNYASNAPSIRLASQSMVNRSIELGKGLGIKNVVLHTCFYPVLSDVFLYELWCENASRYINELVARFDVDIFVENTLDLTPEVLLLLMKETANPRVNICLDVGHAFLSRTPLEQWFDALHPYIKYMHLNDNNGFYDDHLALGDGKIDWSLCRRCMRRYSLSPIVTVEVPGVDQIKRSLQYWSML